ncbi:arsenic resistance N-acetyltransferase ArsN2 [Haloprofundus salilacus]|uniref:arsenic resistance N-acetyltransferase ArsN2 n=1 Tax=Haloprofundus salilacus TaxID=2876190 RepID=UPI001CCA06F4|nr:arsenic resistance N-acetyltransferase ArsN2 [Haloprofundus salilacus]
MSVTLRRVGADDVAYLERLLERNGLPCRDVQSKVDCFYVAYVGSETLGIGGIEAYDSDGLLRSVVVEQSMRGEGFGKQLCGALETEARSEGVETLYLLTTTAPRFFANLGYREIRRADAPATIRRTTEFDDLCPTTATCMRKQL